MENRVDSKTPFVANSTSPLYSMVKIVVQAATGMAISMMMTFAMREVSPIQ